MRDTAALLGALQLSDSALPVGRFVHSQGVESWLAAHPEATPEEIAELAASVADAAARVDGVFLVGSIHAPDLTTLQVLDGRLTARKTVPSARAMSTGCGRQLARLSTRLADSSLLRLYADAVERQESDGNLAVASGVLAGALSIDPLTAVAVELRAVVTGTLSVAVRLGRLSPSLAQEQAAALRPRISDACRAALATPLEDAFASMPTLEVAALAHHREPIRFFTT